MDGDDSAFFRFLIFRLFTADCLKCSECKEKADIGEIINDKA